MHLSTLFLLLSLLMLPSCVSVPGVPRAPGVATEAIRSGLVGTWEHTIGGTHLKKCYRADGTAESWLSYRYLSGSHYICTAPQHLTSRWRVARDTVIMWDYRENGVPSTEHIKYRDKIVEMTPDHFVFYSYDHAEERPATSTRASKSGADPF